jgi:thioredoxin reductase (NADPH)
MKYDLVILGAGVSGLGAAVYATRFGMKTLVLGELMGGVITTTHVVENYPGFITLTGLELGNKLKDHAVAVGAEIVQRKVTSIEAKDGGFVISDGKDSWEGKTLLIATGTSYRSLNVPGEKELANKGVSYCATCDGPFFKNKTVAIIGGSDSAVKESLFLAEHAAKVYIIYRGEQVHPEPINLKRMEANEKIEVVNKSNVVEIYGNGKVEGVKLDTGKDMKLDGVFVAIGHEPRNELIKNLGITLTEWGEVIIDKESRTNVPRIYAAGDITDTEWKQAIVGVAEGVKAAHSAFEDLGDEVGS